MASATVIFKVFSNLDNLSSKSTLTWTIYLHHELILPGSHFASFMYIFGRKARPDFHSRGYNYNRFLPGITMMGLPTLTLPSIEKRFSLSAKEMGIIAASNDVSALILVVFISFYGDYGNKIRWIGVGGLIVGMSVIVQEVIMQSVNRITNHQTTEPWDHQWHKNRILRRQC